MNVLDSAKEFLIRLRKKYGDVLGLPARLKSGRSRSEVVIKQQPVEPTPTPRYAPPAPRYTPPTSSRPKFSPISIASLKDWMNFRMNAENLSELERFFRSQTDSQSPMFLDIIKQYKSALTKKLSSPEDDIDEDTSCDFAEKLAGVIRRDFYTILSSCQSGMRNNNFKQKLYYQQIGRFIDIYFDRIGLKTLELKRGDHISKAEDHVNADVIPTQNPQLDKIIDEVIIQPRYFEYHQNDGQVARFWIDGKCVIYKKM